MKHCSYLASFCALLWGFWALAPNVLPAQTFQRQYGNNLNNSFTKIIQSGTAYYVLGSDQSAAGGANLASVTRLDANGQVLWTRRLNVASVWLDAALTPNGNLFLVGHTLPLDANAQSLMGVIQSNGAFAWVNSYNVTGREAFTRVVRNPSPQSAANPYYVLGFQKDPSNASADWDDVVLLTVSEAGSIGWKRRINNASDDEFSRDLLALSNGDLILSGNRGNNGVVLRFDKTGAYQGGASPEGLSFSFNHVTRSTSGGYFAVGQTFPNGQPYLLRFDDELLNLWENALLGLTTATQVWEAEPGVLYICGTGLFNGKNRAVVMRVTDTGSGAIVDWTRYLDKMETSYLGGSIRLLTGNRLAFVDGRVPLTGGFGGVCAFASVSDLNLATCMTQNTSTEATNLTFTYNSPDVFPIEPATTPQGTAVATTAVTWQQQDACATACVAAFNAQPLGINPCGLFQFNNTSTGPATLTYSWNFGDPNSGNNNTSTAMTPTHQFTACGTYTVCLTVTGNGCTNSACQTVTFTDATPPVVTCPQNLTLQCNTNTAPPATGVATASDNCTAAADIVFNHTDQVSGLMPCDATILRTWSARDKCGNSSTCRQTVFVRDNVPPTFNPCPPNTTVSTDIAQCFHTAVPPNATDNCDPTPTLACTWTDPNGTVSPFVNTAQFPKGVNTVRCTATDDCNNTATCIYNVTVQDQVPPTIVCPGNAVLVGAFTPAPVVCKATAANLAPTTSDNCTMVNLSYTITGSTTGSGSGDVNGTMFMGNSTVNYTVVDMGNNTRTCSFTVVVRCDSCTCPGSAASQNLIGNGDFSLGNAGFSSAWPFSNSCNTGTYGIATNFNTFCSSWPNLPAHSAPSFLALDGSIGSGAADVWKTTVTLAPNTNYCFSFWWASVYATNQQAFTVSMDILNNSGAVQLNVGTETISQSQAAVWTQKTVNFNSGTLSGAYTIRIQQTTSTIFRDWGIDDICLTKVPVPCTAAFTPEPLDPCGKYNFINQSVGATGQLWNFGDPMSGANNTSTLQSPMHQFSKCGTFNVCLTITCADGTTNTICKTVTVTDNVPPIAKCKPGVGVTLNPNCAYNVTTQFVDDGSTDNCQIQSLAVNPTTLTGCANHTVTLTVTDWCGNTATCTMGIQTIETTPPTITCPPNATVTCQTGLTPWPGVATAVDNCPGAVTITFTDATNGLIPCDATVTRTWKATDACNNMSTCTQTVFVRDNVPPAIQCPPSTTVACVPNPLPGQATATDNCDPAPAITVTAVNTGQLPCDGAIVRTWKATDRCNNMSTCIQTITVKDNVPPTIQCPPNSTVNTLPGLCYYQGNIPQPTGTDNCGRPVTFTCSLLAANQSILIDPRTEFPKGVNTISCIANDTCGNGSQPCTYTLTVRDQELPDIFCPLSTMVLGTVTPPPTVCKATLNNLAPFITDNCPMTNLAYVITGATTANGTGNANGTMFMQGASTVTYTVTDMAGNSKTCSFTITVKCATATGGVIGVKYRECNSAPYTNQATVAGWPIALYEEDGVTLLAETATDSAGTYRFADLPYGIYLVKELPFPGAEPTAPESGQQLVEIRSPQPVPIHFGNCFKECEKCPSTSVPGANLVLNGDFEGGNNGQFMSGYPYFAPAPGMPIGRYSVMNAAQVVGANPQWNCTNHTPGGQLMLVVDGTNSSSNVAWKPSVPIAVQPNNNYVFCAFFNNLVRKDRNYADARVSVWINGIQVVAPVTLPENPDMWVPIVVLWPSTTNTSANIEIRVANTSPIGSDFAVDDISFRICRPTDCVADFNFQSVNNCDKVQFTSTSQGAVAYAWNFGDPMSGANNTSALQNPMHNFSKCGTYTVCLTITCVNGTTATLCKTVAITDNTPPIAKCNLGVGVVLNQNCTYTVTPQFVDGGSTDNCRIQSLAVNPATLTGCANHTVTLTVTDWCGNTSTCTMGIQTGESTPPTITCPPNATVTCQTGLNPWPGTPTAVDNCPGTVAITFTDATSGLMPCDATVTRTWKATDACNNMSTCTQTVFVRDNVLPTVMCPPNSTVNTAPGQCFFSGPFPAATATDNCDQTPTTTCFILLNGVFIPITPNTQLPKGDHPIRCRAEDDCGNLSLSCTYTLTVRDNEPPKITCPLGMTILGSINADGLCKALVNNLDATVTDNCPMASVTGYVITGATTGTGTGNLSNVSFMQGVSTVTYTATDMAGNTATCSFMVTVRCQSCACPAGTFPGQELVANGDFEAGLTGFTSDYTLVSPVCNPGWRNVANSTTVVPMCNNWACTDHTTGSPTGLFFVADGSTTLGQAAWRETVNVAANTKYYLCAFVNNLNEINFDRADPVIEVYIKDGFNVSTLIAGPITLPEAPDVWIQIGGTWTSPGTLNGPYRLEFRTANQSFEGNNFALDDISFRACGSTAPCEAAFVPEPLGPCGKFNFISQSVGQITAYAWNFGDPMSGANNTSTLQSPMHQFSKCGTFNVCLTITCANGTTSTICHPVTVTDNTPPVAKCNLGVGVILNANCVYTVTPQFVDGGSTDNCQIQSLSVNPTTLTGCANHTVTLTVTDWCGNTSTCTMGIQTGESTPPTMTCPPNATVTCQTGLTPWPGAPTAVDNCPGAVAITFTDATNGLMPCDATVTRTWKATDACNNISTCTQTVFVRDNVLPVIQCPPSTTVACVPNPLPGQATATDNCDPAPAITVTTVNTGQLPCNGAIVRTWKATDRCNNMSTCVQTITVKDDVPPAIVCPPNATVNTLPGVCHYQGNIPQPTGTDNCGGTITFQCSWLTTAQSILISPQTQFTKGINNISCIATDACGNGSQPCNFTLTVQDKEPPRITCPQNMTVQGIQTPPPVVCKATVNNLAPTVTDNCPMTTVTYTITGATTATGSNDASGTMFMQGVSTVVYTVVDMGGNSATCSFTVTVRCTPSCDCCPAGNTPGPDLISNGHFTIGDDGSFVSLTAACNSCVANRRCVGNEFRSKCSLWPDDFWDNTVGTAAGQFLIIDGPEMGPATNVWSNSSTNVINVTAGTTYSFSFWAASIYSDQFQLGMIVNSVNVNTVTVSQATPQWTKYCTNWTATANGTVTLAIQLLTSGERRDFGIDDICFHACKSSCATTITANPGLIVCPGQSTTLTATGGPWATCQWNNSVSGPSIVVTVPGTYCVTCTDASGCTATACATVEPCNNCTCIPNSGGFTNMSYRPNSGPNQPIACGQTAIWQCVLPTFTMGGNFACQGNNCSPTGAAIPMFWTLKKGITPITNGTMSGPGFNLSFPSSSFATAGVYTLTLAGICGMDTCYCEIKIETPGCGDCVCIPNGGGFTNMTYRPNSGPNQPIACGQTAIWQCVLPTFTMGGNFACQGNNCSPTGAAIPMFWTLKKGSTPITNGTMSGPAFNLSFPSSSFATAGVYTLTLAGICGMDTCYCEIKIETPGCGDCVCIPNGGGFTNMSYRPNSGPNQPIACGQTAIWQCVLPTFTMGGNFACQGNNCSPTGAAIPMFWTLKKGSTPITNGTMSGPSFNLSFPSSSFATAGVYTLTLAGICGMDTCYCEIKIETPGCGCTCGTYADMFWRPAQGAPSQSVKCGDGLELPCNPTFNPVLSGNFQCKGANCPTAIPMFWTLTGPTGVPPQSGTAAGPNFNIPLNASFFSMGGTYNLTLGAICGTDTCYCRFTIKAAACNCWTNNCLNFDGTDDFVNVNSPLGAAPGNFSVGCWFRNERTMPATNAFFYRLFGWTGTDRFELGDKNGFLSFFSNTTGPNEVVSTANIRDGRWHYVVVTYNGNTVSTFLDAQPVPALTLAIGALNNMSPTFHLGDWGGGASDPRFWDGCIDDFKVWNTALTATQVSDAMQCGADPSNANLLLYFNFNQGIADGNNTGLTTAIATKGSNNGTLSNFALNAQSSNWTYRGASELPACQAGVFLALEGNPGVNTAQRTKVYNGDIYSLGTERTVGSNQIRPTLIRRDAAGTIVWRTVLNIEGYANDFVMTQDGCDFLIVGHRPAFAGNNSAWIARVRNSDGALLWLRTFNLGRRESFTRILLSDNPQNPAFPYVVLGVVNNGNTGNDDIHLFTLSDAGVVGTARRYNTGGDDEFFKDLIQLQGGYIVAGNIANRSVLVFTDNALTPQALRTFRFQQAGPYIWDVEPSANGRFLYVAGQVSIGGQLQGFLAKIDYTTPTAPAVLWSNRFPNVSSFRKVTVRPNGDLHALGLRPISANSAEHNVILRGQDNGNTLATLWLRHIYRSPESQWTLGDIVHYNGQRVFYTDGRLNNPATYGNMDILKVMADNDLASVGPTCLVNLGVTSVALPLALTALNIPQTAVQMPSTAGGTATLVPLPMRDPCRDEPCACKYENLEFALGQNFIWKNFSCAAPSVSDVPCPLQNQPVYFSGKLTCLGNCQFNGLSWVIKNPSGMVIASGSSPSNPVFSIAITLAMVQTPGVYTIELVGKCGTQECRCMAQFRVKDCPKPCACSPLGAFQADVNAGFNYFKFPAPSCKFQFTPKKLTDCDQVQWKVAKASDLVFTIVGTSIGNAPFQYTFPTDLTQYVVCMDVTRTVPGTTPPQTCQYSRCYLIDLDCSILAGAGERGLGAACAGGVVLNSGFTQDAEAGGLLSGGAAFGWDASDGDPTVVLAPGRPDSNFVRLRGNRVYADRLYQDSLPTLSGRAQLRFSFRLRSASVVEGTELVVRLSKEVQDSSACLGECQEIMRFAVPTDTAFNDLWLTAFSGDSIAVRGQYLTIQVENPLTQDDAALQSVIDIDDICLRSLNFVPVHTAGEAPYQLRLFPNPNTGYFTVELPAPAPEGTRFRVTDLAGRLLLEQTAQSGAARQTVEANALPAGMYFLAVLEEGRVRGVVRFVKVGR